MIPTIEGDTRAIVAVPSASQVDSDGNSYDEQHQLATQQIETTSIRTRSEKSPRSIAHQFRPCLALL